MRLSRVDTSRSSPVRPGRILRGSSLSVETISRIRRDYWPQVTGWKEYLQYPLPYFKGFGVVYQVAGRDKVGKSRLLSIIAARHTKNRGDVIYVTTEFPAELIHQSLLDLGADPDKIVYLDYSAYPHGVLGSVQYMRESTPYFKTLFYQNLHEVVTTVSGDPVLVVVDSMTSFYEYVEAAGRVLAGNLVRTIRSIQDPPVLAFAVSQKRTQHSEFTTEVAGGLGVSHLMDGTFIMAKYRASPFRRIPPVLRSILDAHGGAVITIRWDGCRWGPHPFEEFIVRFQDNDVVLEGSLDKLVRDLTRLNKGGMVSEPPHT